MFKITQLNKSFWEKDIFIWAEMNIYQWLKSAIVWSNWWGKSTLLRILSWLDADYEWQITFDIPNCTISYMKQLISTDNYSQTIIEFIREYTGIDKIQQEIDLLSEDLSDTANLQAYSDKYETFEKMWWWSFETEVEKVMWFLWLSKYDQFTPINILSWWEKNKLLLCATLLQWWDLMLLDEPTNNLDLESIRWLTKFINSSNSSFLIISHDKDFLNNVVTKIFEINDITKKIVEYSWDYEFYTRSKEIEYNNKLLEYEQNMQEYTSMKKASKDLHQKADKIIKKWNAKDNDKWDWWAKVAKKLDSAAKAMRTRMDKIDMQEKPRPKKPLRLSLNSWVKVTWSIKIDNIKYTYPNSNFTLRIKSIDINNNDKIRIKWQNGQWKSTFIKILMWEIKTSNIYIHNSINIWYYSQTDNNINTNQNCIQYIQSRWNFDTSEINFVLSKLWFEESDIKNNINLLSPGMKSRLLFAIISLRKCNCIIFDEPTNHLDIETAKQIELTINDFEWMVIVVSHDQKFVDNIKFTKHIEFTNWNGRLLLI